MGWRPYPLACMKPSWSVRGWLRDHWLKLVFWLVLLEFFYLVITY